jgi:hypothetical protein
MSLQKRFLICSVATAALSGIAVEPARALAPSKFMKVPASLAAP